MSLAKKKILILVADEYEDLELQYPKYRLREAGAQVVIAGPKAKELYKGKKGYPCLSDISLDQVKVSDYSALIVPGGNAPDKLRRIPKAVEIVKAFSDAKKPIGFICHAGSLLISAKVLKGVKCTSYDSIKEDMINAGAKWVDEDVVVDKHFVSSRTPEDLPVFCPAIITLLTSKK